MAFNIVDLVKSQISDTLLEQMAGAAGTDNQQASTALSGAVPGLLGGLTSFTNKPGGAGSLLDAVNKQDDGLLGNLGSMLGQGQGNQVSEQGSSLLTSLLGGGALSTLADAVGNFAGIGRNHSSSLLGMLAPIVIGVLKKQVLGSGLNASGLSSMLSSQQSNIDTAMPQGVSEQLSNQNFFDSIAGGGNTITPDATTGTVSAPNTPNARAVPHTETQATGGLPKWLIPAAVIAGLVVVGLFLFSGSEEPDVAAISDPASQVASDGAAAVTSTFSSVTEGVSSDAMAAARAALPQGVDMDALTDQLDSTFATTTSALDGITDTDSATAALPQLTEASESASQFGEVFKRLPDAAKGPLASMLQSGVAAVQPALEKAMAIPGVGPILEPVVTPMLASISDMAS